MVVAPKPEPYVVSQRRAPDVRQFKRDSYHPDCYISQEEVKARQFNIKKVEEPKREVKNKSASASRALQTTLAPGGNPKPKKVVLPKEAFDHVKSKAKVRSRYLYGYFMSEKRSQI